MNIMLPLRSLPRSMMPSISSLKIFVAEAPVAVYSAAFLGNSLAMTQAQEYATVCYFARSQTCSDTPSRSSSDR